MGAVSASTGVLATQPAGKSVGCIFLRDRSLGSYNPNKAEALAEENKMREKKASNTPCPLEMGLESNFYNYCSKAEKGP